MRRLRVESLVVTCEHGGARVPARWRAVFAGRDRLLASHRGWDPGALDLARSLARPLGAPLLASRVTRLLVDLNRSIGHPALHAELVRDSGADLAAIVARHWAPHRAAVDHAIAAALARGARAVHVAAHTFTPVLRRERRTVDVGILFDPNRLGERAIAERWRAGIVAAAPRLRVRMNAPYRGTSDGLPTALRRRHPDARYAGIELEVSQRFPRRGGAPWERLRRLLAETLARALATR